MKIKKKQQYTLPAIFIHLYSFSWWMCKTNLVYSNLFQNFFFSNLALKKIIIKLHKCFNWTWNFCNHLVNCNMKLEAVYLFSSTFYLLLSLSLSLSLKYIFKNRSISLVCIQIRKIKTACNKLANDNQWRTLTGTWFYFHQPYLLKRD